MTLELFSNPPCRVHLRVRHVPTPQPLQFNFYVKTIEQNTTMPASGKCTTMATINSQMVPKTKQIT